VIDLAGQVLAVDDAPTDVEADRDRLVGRRKMRASRSPLIAECIVPAAFPAEVWIIGVPESTTPSDCHGPIRNDIT
jgi:hypothetical protein